MTVALSRARLGLYILGRRDIFESCFELRQAFEILLKRPDKLMLCTGEMWPSKRILAEEVDSEVPGEAVMEGVDHLGQFVFEMTKSKIKQSQEENGVSAGTLMQQGHDAVTNDDGEYVENELDDDGELEEEEEDAGGVKDRAAET